MPEIPLFSGSVGSSVAPLTPPVESLSVDAYRKGAATAADVPSTATAIAKGVTEGVDTYQRQSLNQERLTAAKRSNAQQAALDPLQLQTAQLQLQQEQDKIAEETQIKQERDALFEVFKGDDGNAKLDAVTSGKFAKSFAADPKLEDYAVKVATPYMDEDQRAAFIKNSYDTQLRGITLRDQAARQKEYDRAESDLVSSSEMDSILNDPKNAKRFDHSPQAFIDRAEPVRQGTYEIDPRNGLPKRYATGPMVGQIIKKNVDPEPGAKQQWQFVDKKTKEVLAEGLSDEFATNFEKYRSRKSQLEKSGIMRKPVSTIVQENTPRAQKIIGENAPKLIPGSSNQRIPLAVAEKRIATTPLVAQDGKVIAKDNPAVGGMIVQTLGLTPEEAANFPHLNEISSALHDDIEASTKVRTYGWGWPTDEVAAPAADAARLKQRDEWTRAVLTKQFPREGSPTVYNDTAVKEHNDAYHRWVQNGNDAGADDLQKIGGVFKEIDSPEDLFVEKNYPSAAARLDAIWTRSVRAGKLQVASKIDKHSTATALLDSVKIYK